MGSTAVGTASVRGGGTVRVARTPSNRARERAIGAPASSRSSVRFTRRGRLVLILMVLAVASAVFTFVGSPAASTAVSHHSTAPTVVVRPGQTLWTIAARVDSSADPRQVVAEIMDLNNLTDPGGVRVGQLLYLPRQ